MSDVQEQTLGGPGGTPGDVSDSGPARTVVDDRLTRLLVGVVAALLIAVLAAMGIVVYYAVNPPSAPRTAVEDAVFSARERVEREPGDEDAWAEYVRVLLLTGELSRAEDALRDAEAALGEEAGILSLGEARILAARGDESGALVVLEDHLVELFEQREAYIEEVDAQGIVTTTSPFDDDIVAAAVLQGDLLVEAGDMDGAAEAYTIALDINPTMADIFVARGDVHAGAGRLEEARADYESALVLIPDYPAAVAGIGELGGGDEQ